MKIALLGNQEVGKTKIIQRLCNNSFDPSSQPTIGVDWSTYKLKLKEQIATLKIFETSGQVRFRSLIPSYLKDMEAVIFVYDITKRGSFLELKDWDHMINENEKKIAIKLVLGNKLDRLSEREVSYEEAEKFAHSIGASYVEASALRSDNIEDAFISIIEKYIHENESQKEIEFITKMIEKTEITQINATEETKVETEQIEETK